MVIVEIKPRSVGKYRDEAIADPRAALFGAGTQGPRQATLASRRPWAGMLESITVGDEVLLVEAFYLRRIRFAALAVGEPLCLAFLRRRCPILPLAEQPFRLYTTTGDWPPNSSFSSWGSRSYFWSSLASESVSILSGSSLSASLAFSAPLLLRIF